MFIDIVNKNRYCHTATANDTATATQTRPPSIATEI